MWIKGAIPFLLHQKTADLIGLRFSGKRDCYSTVDPNAPRNMVGRHFSLFQLPQSESHEVLY